MNAEVLYDFTDSYYKTPFGAVSTAQRVSLRIRVRADVGAKGAAVFFRKHTHFFSYTCIETNRTQTFTEYACEFILDREGVYYYRFEVYTDYGVRFCGKGENGQALFGDWLPEWQLSVYKDSFSTPDEFKGGVVYQIFCDRFCKKGESPLPRYGTVKKWTDEVGETDEQGVYRADDFFGGNFAGIESKLDYLCSLGVTHLYLSPIFESNSNHRYDTADYSHVEPMLGGEEGFLSLLRKAKEKGIGILLDGVFNHTGSDSVYFNKEGHYPSVGAYQSTTSPYSSWYTFYDFPDEYRCWWGIPCVPTVSRNAVGFQKEIEENVLKKWTKAGVSGWRLDVADELSDAFLDGIRRAVKETNENAVVIGEVWEDASTKESYGEERRYFQGEQLDGVMNYVFQDAVIRYLLDGDATAFCSSVWLLAENYPAKSLDCCLTLLDSHDTFRILTALSGAVPPETKEARRRYRLSQEEYERGKKRLFLAACLQYFLPGVPSLYYGDEIGLEGFEDPFNRRPYPWGQEDTEILTHYQKLGSLRKKYRSLFLGMPRLWANGTAVTMQRGSLRLTVDPVSMRFEISE